MQHEVLRFSFLHMKSVLHVALWFTTLRLLSSGTHVWASAEQHVLGGDKRGDAAAVQAARGARGGHAAAASAVSWSIRPARAMPPVHPLCPSTIAGGEADAGLGATGLQRTPATPLITSIHDISESLAQFSAPAAPLAYCTSVCCKPSRPAYCSAVQGAPSENLCVAACVASSSPAAAHLFLWRPVGAGQPLERMGLPTYAPCRAKIHPIRLYELRLLIVSSHYTTQR